MISVVTVTYGTGPVVAEMLASLAATHGDGSYEVVVVDNPHPTRPGRSARQLAVFAPGVPVVTAPRNVGFGGGCELGVLHTSGDVLAFVNPDVTFTSDALTRLAGTLHQLRATAVGPVIVAPVLRNPDGSVQEAGQRVDPAGHVSRVSEMPEAQHAVPVTYASAACWVITRADHERLGGFDPAFHPAYYEDVDLALRAREAGGGCWLDPAVSVVHAVGTGTPELPPPIEAQRRVLVAKHPSLRWAQAPRADTAAPARQRP